MCHLRSSFPLRPPLPFPLHRSTFPDDTNLSDELWREINRRSQGLALWSERHSAILALYLLQDGSFGFLHPEVSVSDSARDGTVAPILGMSIQPEASILPLP